eukprot:6187472-Pleurochrysis_carterae.AAC.3
MNPVSDFKLRVGEVRRARPQTSMWKFAMYPLPQPPGAHFCEVRWLLSTGEVRSSFRQILFTLARSVFMQITHALINNIHSAPGAIHAVRGREGEL